MPTLQNTPICAPRVMSTAQSRHDAERMLEVLQEMRELQTAVGDAPIDWSRVDKVLTALVMRRIAKFENDERMNDIARSAAQSVVK